jgi:uncharacterized RDD family membrane protein YckC
MKVLVSAIVGGVIITLVTGLLQNAPYLMGATYYGYPFSWLVDEHGAPPNFDIYKISHLRYLGADIVIWAIIIGLILFGISKLRKK